MPYREQVLCAYCDRVEASSCSRCGCRLCTDHRPDREGWCWACAKEIKDELELIQFKSLITTPKERYAGSGALNEVWGEVASLIASVRQRRARKKLIERTREQIEQWRRAAGIETRW